MNIFNSLLRRGLLICVFHFVVLSLWAKVELPNVFSDNMVLQQGKLVNVWGTADSGERITVKFAKQTLRTTADSEGRWNVQLQPMTATVKPSTLSVRGKENKVVYRNVLVGEVWLASGQSNMEYSMNDHPKYHRPKKSSYRHEVFTTPTSTPDTLKQEFLSASNPLVRVLYVEKNLSTDTLPSTGWHIADTTSLAPVSAAGYFFAKRLVEELGVPVGIISTSWGGSPIEHWLPLEDCQNTPSLASQLVNGKIDGKKVGMRYDKMVRPLIPFSLRGFLWYQGETNLIEGDMQIYADKQRALIDGWRRLWNDETLPFYYVQLAPHNYTQRKDGRLAYAWDVLPRFWEVQTALMEVPYSGMIVSTDLVDYIGDIHPSYKWVVGERLALWALHHDYGKKEVEYSGPKFKSLKVDGKKIIIEFDHAANGLKTSDGKAPDWFYVWTKRGRYQQANAQIDGSRIILTHDQLKPSEEVRFGWDEAAMPNLLNAEGLPAIPFRVKL